MVVRRRKGSASKTKLTPGSASGGQGGRGPSPLHPSTPQLAEDRRSPAKKKGRSQPSGKGRKMGHSFPRGKTQLSEHSMRCAGIDLHKRSLTICIIDKETGETFTTRFSCQEEARIVEFFEKQKPFQAVVEATATYDWLWVLLEPLAERLVLAHPKKLRIIAESKKKTDRFDARNLAWMLAKDEIPEAYRPSPRQREYQHLIKHRHGLIRQSSRLKVQIRSILAAR